jgi:hypothetical protein
MKKYLYICFFLFGNAFSAGQIDFLPDRILFFSTSTLEFRHYLYTGSENGRVVNHGNLGVEFPVIGFSLKEGRHCLAGMAAAVHLVMFPKDMKFAVDNFYATLAVYADCIKSEKFSCRLYPIYHVSGHLADGASHDSALTHVHAVSGEMARFEVACSPLTGATLSGGYGYYYHVCAQQGLTDRFDLAVLWQPVPAARLTPCVTVTGQFIHLSRWRAGVDLEAGLKIINAHARGVGFGFRYFSRMNEGYYFDHREESFGMQVDFLL